MFGRGFESNPRKPHIGCFRNKLSFLRKYRRQNVTLDVWLQWQYKHKYNVQLYPNFHRINFFISDLDNSTFRFYCTIEKALSRWQQYGLVYKCIFVSVFPWGCQLLLAETHCRFSNVNFNQRKVKLLVSNYFHIHHCTENVWHQTLFKGVQL